MACQLYQVLDRSVEVLCKSVCWCRRVMRAGVSHMGSVTKYAGVKEPAVRQGAAQMIEVVACRPASLMQDWPASMSMI